MAIDLSHLMDIRFDIREPVNVGESQFGNRVIYDITGGFQYCVERFVSQVTVNLCITGVLMPMIAHLSESELR